MPNIKPVSDLRSYNEVLRDVAVGEPVFLTKNGRGRQPDDPCNKSGKRGLVLSDFDFFC